MKTVLGGAKRKLGCQTKIASPFLPVDLNMMFAQMSRSSGHLAIRAAILTAFRGLLRKCQIRSSDSVLLRSDFSFFPLGHDAPLKN